MLVKTGVSMYGRDIYIEIEEDEEVEVRRFNAGWDRLMEMAFSRPEWYYRAEARNFIDSCRKVSFLHRFFGIRR